jgi:hypothetical protein
MEMTWIKYKLPPFLYGKIRFDIFEENLLRILDRHFYNDREKWKQHNQKTDTSDSDDWETKQSRSVGSALRGFHHQTEQCQRDRAYAGFTKEVRTAYGLMNGLGYMTTHSVGRVKASELGDYIAIKGPSDLQDKVAQLCKELWESPHQFSEEEMPILYEHLEEKLEKDFINSAWHTVFDILRMAPDYELALNRVKKYESFQGDLGENWEQDWLLRTKDAYWKLLSLNEDELFKSLDYVRNPGFEHFFAIGENGSAAKFGLFLYDYIAELERSSETYSIGALFKILEREGVLKNEEPNPKGSLKERVKHSHWIYPRNAEHRVALEELHNLIQKN